MIRRSFAAAAAVLALLLATLLSASPAAADVNAAASQLKQGPGLYVDPQAVGNPLPQDSLDRVKSAIEQSRSPIFMAALPDTNSSAVQLHLRTLVDKVHKKGVYAVFAPGGFYAGDDLNTVNAADLAQRSIRANQGNREQILLDFITSVSAATGPGSGASSGGGLGAGGVLVVLLVILAGGAGLVALMASRRRRRQEQAAFGEVRGAAEEDVTALGEDIARLDVPSSANDATRGDYQGALDAYDRAKAALAAARGVVDLQAVTEALEEGRWRMECVRARLAGRPVPDRLPPCFFDPRHGPSVTQVPWSPDGGQPRSVPVCALDAERLARGVEPQVRQVLVQGSPVPYWSAGPMYAPYAGGFFGGWGGGSFLSGLLLGEVLGGPGFGPFGGGFGGYGYGPGYGPDLAGYEGDGGADNRGDVGGGDGGGDFAGGFDFGGGGWGGDGGGGGGGGGDSSGGSNW